MLERFTRPVVCNTGPLLALSHVDQVGLLARLFPEVIVPVEVVEELLQTPHDDLARWRRCFASANRFCRTITTSASGASAGYVARHVGPIFASECSSISESENYCLHFVHYIVPSKQQTLYMAQIGGAQPHIHAKNLNPILVSIPPVPEQTAIASVLTAMDEELEALEQRREKTRALKQAMMQELLTGRTRLVARGAAERAEVKP